MTQQESKLGSSKGNHDEKSALSYGIVEKEGTSLGKGSIWVRERGKREQDTLKD